MPPTPRSRRTLALLLILICASLAAMMFGKRGSVAVKAYKQSSALTSCAAPPSGLVSWWPGDRNAGDRVGNNNGVLQNGASFVAGKVGQAFSLDGIDDSIEFPGNGTLDIAGDQVTVEAWISLENSQTSAQVFTATIGKNNFPGNQSYLITFESGSNVGLPQNTWRFEYILTNSAGVRVHNQQTNVDVTVDGNYHHYAMTYNGAASPSVKLYVDGVLQNTNIPDAAAGNLRSLPTTPVTIRGGFSGNAASFSADEVSIYNRALSQFEIQSVHGAGSAGKCVSCTPLPANAISWFPAEGNANDVLGNNNGTLVNGTTFTPGKVGQAFSLDDQDDYVDLGQLSQLQNATELTVMAWVKKKQLGRREGFVGKWDSSDNTDNSFLLYNGGAGNPGDIGVFALAFANGAEGGIAGSTVIPAGEWVQVTGTWRSSDGQIRIYKNGVIDGESTGGIGQTLKFLSGYTAKIGHWGIVRNGDFKFYGEIDETQIFNRALSQTEVQAIYNANSAGACGSTCTPPPSQMVSWFPGAGNANDIQSGNNGTLQNGATFTQGRVGQAFSFDGVDDFVSVPDSDSLDIIGDITIEAWINPTTIAGDQRGIVSKREFDNSKVSYVFFLQPNGHLEFFANNGAASQFVQSTGIVPTNTFTHVAVTISGTALTLFINGVPDIAATFSVTRPATAGRLTIGKPEDNTGAVNAFAGSIDELSLYKRALSSTEILAIFNASRSGKCGGNCAPVPANAVTWFKGDGNASDVFGGNIGTLQGGATFMPGRVGQAFSFDGVDDSVQFPNFITSANTFTFEFWMNISSFTHPNYMAPLCQGQAAFPHTANPFCFYTGNGGSDFGFEGQWTDGSNFNLRTGIPFGTGVWKHIAITYDGTTLRQYVDGSYRRCRYHEKPKQ